MPPGHLLNLDRQIAGRITPDDVIPRPNRFAQDLRTTVGDDDLGVGDDHRDNDPVVADFPRKLKKRRGEWTVES
jgi:hypothetical protein